MPYCKTVFVLPCKMNVVEALSAFARESFVGGIAAYEIDHNRFLIDAGENDIRAIYDEDRKLVKFFCRYKEDEAKYEKKLQKFAAFHNIRTQSYT